MTSKIVVNNIEADAGVSTITFGSEISASKIVTSSGEFTVGTGASVYSPATNVLALGTNNAERLRITSSGNVGIGITNPLSKLHLSDTSGALIINRETDSLNQISFRTINTHRGSIGANSGACFTVYDASSAEKLRIDSSGRLLLGDPSAVINLKYGGSSDFGSQSYVYGANDGFSNGLAILNYDATATVPALLKLCSSRNDTVGINTVVGNTGDKIAAIQFMGNDGTRFIDLARIDAETDGTVGANDMPGRLMFNVTADGASVVTERMRISHNGGTSHFATAAAHGFRATQTAGTDSILFVQNNSSSVTTGSNVFIVRADGDVENATGNYTAFSDQKLKENIVDANSQWDDIKSIQIRNFNFKEETGLPTHTQIGVIAQELEQICPNLVKDVKVTNDGEDTYKTVKSSILYMKTVKALQEAMERIETLEAKVASLENP